MSAYAALPAGPAPRAALMVFPEVFGVNAHMRSVTNRFAQEGYLALCPEVFHRTAPAGWEGDYADWSAAAPHYQALTEDGFLADAEACFDWLKGQGAGAVGAVGFCLGGRIAFVANSALPLFAAVSYYGGNIAPGNLPRAKDQQGPLLMHWGARTSTSPRRWWPPCRRPSPPRARGQQLPRLQGRLHGEPLQTLPIPKRRRSPANPGPRRKTGVPIGLKPPFPRPIHRL